MGSTGKSYTVAYHMTSEDSANSIVNEGRFRNFGANADVWGGGSYFSTDTADVEHWGDRFGQAKVQVDVDTQGFLKVNLSEDYNSISEYDNMFRDASKAFNKKQLAYFKSTLAGLEKWGGENEEAFFATISKFKIKGLVIKYDNPQGASSLVGGNQIVVYDQSAIKSIKRG